MIRLIVAMVVCVALQPASPPAPQRHEHTIAAATVGRAAAVVVAPSLDVPLPAAATSVPALPAPSWMAAPAAALRSARVVARLWLRGQRLLC